MMNFQKAVFVTSAAKISQCPADQGSEVAFVGRSNCGKSSALNALCRQKSLARTSRTPGRTQLINFFELEKNIRLVDLPGYGFAKVTDSKREEWGKVLTEYIETRKSLRGLVILMDSRRPLTALDEKMLLLAQSANRPIHIVLTKADKLSKSQQNQQLLAVKKSLTGMKNVSIQLFSALKKQGVEELEIHTANWLK